MALVNRYFLALSAFASLLLGCDSESTEQSTVDRSTHLVCKIARSDSGKTQDCRCYELTDRNDTVSEGMRRIDSTGRPLYRKGWHTFYSDSGIVRIHYTAVQYHADSSFDENVNQVIHIDHTGDTMFERSTYVKTRAPDSLHLGSPFIFHFQYFSPDVIDSIDVATMVSQPDDDNKVNFADRRRYAFHQIDWFTSSDTPTDTGHYILHGVLYGNRYSSNNDSMFVVTCFFDHPFVVIP